jgi:AcrR family transcriptional regulator
MTAVGAARPRLTRAESRQRTRELLVEAAMQVFARDGYAGASVDAIAAQAGFTVGAVYSNFATKQDLFLAAFERHCQGELASLAALVEEHRSFRELLQAVTDRFADLDQAHREWWTLWGELWLYAQRRPDGAARLAQVQAQTRKVIADALAREIPRPTDQLAAVIHALWTGFMLNRLVDPQALQPGTFQDAVRRLIAGQPADNTGGTS